MGNILSNISSLKREYLGQTHLVLDNSNLLVRSYCTIEMIERLQLRPLVAQNVSLEPPRKRLRNLVSDVHAGRHRKDVVQFLKRALFSLRYEQEDENQCRNVETCVEGESAHRVEGAKDTRERDGEDGGPEEASRHGPGHANFTMRKWEDFSGVGEWDGPFTGRIEGGEEEDEEGDQAEMGSLLLGNDEAKTSC